MSILGGEYVLLDDEDLAHQDVTVPEHVLVKTVEFTLTHNIILGSLHPSMLEKVSLMDMGISSSWEI